MMKNKLFRSLAAALAAALLLGCLAGCGGDTGPAPIEPPRSEVPVTAPPESQMPAESVPPAGSEPPAESESPAVSAPPQPVDIATDGGVVVVGTVNKDEEGWYLAPEQPLNVEFSYFFEPSIFEGLTRLYLFDPEVDGVEKSVYLGQTVTVEGQLSFYRDYFDRLYLLPYTITFGKTVEQSFSAPELQPPEEEDLYDPSVPLPAEMEPTVEDGRYVYNPYILSTETLSRMGNDFAEFYVELVNAVLERRESCYCPNRDHAEMLTTVTFYEFPLYGACAEPFEFFKHYDRDTGMITIPYKFDAAEHRQVVERFMAAANEFLATTAPGQSQQRLATNIYHELCTRVTYDHSAIEDLSRKAAHYAYLEHSGVCITFANVYNQLLNQVGIEATVATCDYLPTMGHAWSLITVDGKQYFCDPTFELNVKDGAAYFYFGMNYAERTQDGVGSGGISAGKYNKYPVTAEMISDKSLQF